ncbi:MAG: dihydroorotate dehydrogenase [Actinomycetaceae bacterium]|nr:dihydroorotate dehydrogenase [Actinomycetaceae bacterium]
MAGSPQRGAGSEQRADGTLKETRAKNVYTTAVDLCGIELSNPVVAASGTFGYGQEFAHLWDINQLGTFSFKGTTATPRPGNAQPRVAESPAGMLNAIGLANPGVDEVVNQILPGMPQYFSKPVMANVAGFSVDEYVHVATLLDASSRVGWLEINISCPNVHEGGRNFADDPDSAAAVIRAVKAEVHKPVIAKLAPHTTNIVSIARACVDAGADALSLVNTFVGMRFDVRRRTPILANKTGGVSGPAILPMALHLVNMVAHAVDVPVIGMGGVSTAHDVLEMMVAGASAVEVGTANLVDPYACRTIIHDLPHVMEANGILSLHELRGSMLDR